MKIRCNSGGVKSPGRLTRRHILGKERIQIRPKETGIRQWRDKLSRDHRRGTGRDVQEHVVEAGVVADAKTATNDRFVFAKQGLS